MLCGVNVKSRCCHEQVIVTAIGNWSVLDYLPEGDRGHGRAQFPLAMHELPLGGHIRDESTRSAIMSSAQVRHVPADQPRSFLVDTFVCEWHITASLKVAGRGPAS